MPPAAIDVRAHNQKWVAFKDRFQERHRDLLMGLTATHLGTYNLFSSHYRVLVYCIKGE